MVEDLVSGFWGDLRRLVEFDKVVKTIQGGLRGVVPYLLLPRKDQGLPKGLFRARGYLGGGGGLGCRVQASGFRV